MGHDEASAGLLHHVTDTHLADRARLGDAVAFDELVRRHAEVVGRFTVVVTGDADLAGPVTESAFTDVFDQIGSGGYSIEEPFLPGLLRSTREIARLRAEPDTAPAATDDAVWHLDEAERSACWLTAVLGMDEYDLALTLDVDEAEAAALAQVSVDHLGDQADAGHELLQGLTADLPPGTAHAARTTWRAWVATVPGSPGAPVPAEPRVRRERRDRRPLAGRFEPVAARVLRGAAVVLLVAGAAGVLMGDGGDGGSSGPRRVAPAEQAAAAGGGRVDAPDLGGEIELSGATRSRAGTSTGADSSSTSGGGRTDAPSSATADGRRAGPSASDRSPGTTGRAGISGTTGSTAGGGTGASSAGSGSGGGSGNPSSPSGPATPSSPTNPTRPSGPSTPSNPPAPSTPPVTSPPPSAPPATTPPTSPPAMTPPPVSPPAPTPAPPSNPVTTVIDVVTGVVTTITGPITGLLGGGR